MKAVTMASSAAVLLRALGAGALVAFARLAAFSADAAVRPNIVVVLADDLESSHTPPPPKPL